MKLFHISRICVVTLLLTVAIICAQEAEGEVEEAPEPKSCQKWIFDLLSIVFDAVGPCLAQSFKITRLSEVVTRVFCLVKCLLTELALLDEEGNLDQVSAAIFFGDNFPEALRNDIVAKADPCFKLADDFNGKEYYCRSYAAFSQCAGTVVIQAMVPYAIGCFGSPFIAAGLNVAFGFLTSQVPLGRAQYPPPTSRKSNTIPSYNNTLVRKPR